MKIPGSHRYWVYIITNVSRATLYIGVTNSLATRLSQHKLDAEGEKRTFTGKYNCYHLVYSEWHQNINTAIAREKELKGWTRAKKVALIEAENPNWQFLYVGTSD